MRTTNSDGGGAVRHGTAQESESHTASRRVDKNTALRRFIFTERSQYSQWTGFKPVDQKINEHFNRGFRHGSVKPYCEVVSRSHDEPLRCSQPLREAVANRCAALNSCAAPQPLREPAVRRFAACIVNFERHNEPTFPKRVCQDAKNKCFHFVSFFWKQNGNTNTGIKKLKQTNFRNVRSLRLRVLRHIQLIIFSALRHKLVVVAGFYDVSFIHNHNPRRVADCA